MLEGLLELYSVLHGVCGGEAWGEKGSVSSRKHIIYIKRKRFNDMYIETIVAIFAR